MFGIARSIYIRSDNGPTVTWVVTGLFINYFGHGMVISYSNCLLPGLRADDSDIKLDLDSASWLASCLGISTMCSCCVITIFMARFGRRWVHANSTFLTGIAWLLIYLAHDFPTLLIGRLLGGFGIASAYVCGCCIVSECVAPEYRGAFLNIKTVALFAGYLCMHVVGHFFHWRTVALFGVIPCVLSLLNNFTWPESPSWLLSKNRFEECEKTFYWLRGRGEKAVKELEAMVRAQKNRMSLAPQNVSYCQKGVSFVKKFEQRSFVKPLVITFFCAIISETSGRHFFPAYALDIITEITDKSNTFFYVIAVDVASCISSIASSVLVVLIGRKTLLMFSGITSTILLLIISLVTYLTSKGINITNAWLVPTLVCIIFVLSNLGCTSVPLIIYGEIFPLPHRETGIGMGGVCLTTAFFLYLKLMPYSLVYLKIHGTFLIFAVGLTVSLVYLYFALPETRNRTLQEIEYFFDYGKFEDDEVSPGKGDENDTMVDAMQLLVVIR